MNQGRDEQGERELTELILIRRRIPGADHRETLSGLSQLGRLYIKQRKYARAEAVL